MYMAYVLNVHSLCTKCTYAMYKMRVASWCIIIG